MIRLARNPKYSRAVGCISFPITLSSMFSGVNSSTTLGCWLTAVKLPEATSRIVTPSNFQVKVSPKSRGLRMAVKIIVKHEVDEMRSMFPYFKATVVFKLDDDINLQALKTRPQMVSPIPSAISGVWYGVFLVFSTLMFAIFMKIMPRAVNRLPAVDDSRAMKFYDRDI